MAFSMSEFFALTDPKDRFQPLIIIFGASGEEWNHPKMNQFLSLQQDEFGNSFDRNVFEIRLQTNDFQISMIAKCTLLERYFNNRDYSKIKLYSEVLTSLLCFHFIQMNWAPDGVNSFRDTILGKEMSGFMQHPFKLFFNRSQINKSQSV